jgi:hypothetical protein
MEHNVMKRALRPSYSPDFAALDFYLFDHVEQLLRGYEFADREALLYAIEDILRGIEKKTLEDVLISWMERLRQYGNAAEEHVE